MTDLPKHKMTADEFLSWAESLPREAGRYELWDGDVIVRHGPAGFENAERAQHWKVKGALYVQGVPKGGSTRLSPRALPTERVPAGGTGSRGRHR